MAQFKSVFNIGSGSPMALPVRDIGPAIAYYVHVLGFEVVEKTDKTATLRRDDANIGLAVNGEDPEQASVYFGVSDVEAVRAELEAKGIEPSGLRVDEHGGNKYRVFFAKEPYGVCFCFGQQL
jgi:lactoylglutathione lyase